MIKSVYTKINFEFRNRQKMFQTLKRGLKYTIKSKRMPFNENMR